MVRRRDNSNVSEQCSTPTYPLEFPLLQHPQQSRLRRKRQTVDLIQKQGAFLGTLEETVMDIIRIGEGTFLMPK